MDEQLNLLIQLQDMDGKIRSLVEQKKRLPEALAELEGRRAANAAELEQTKESLQTAQKNKRDRDKDLEAGVQKVEKLKTRSSEIKNNKDLYTRFRASAAFKELDTEVEKYEQFKKEMK